MKTRTVTVREGEKVGPIDWNYDFRQHFNNMCSPEPAKDKRCEQKKAYLREVEQALEAGHKVTAVFSGQFSHEIYDVGMYDGWPYWRPTPAIFRASPLGGGEWDFFYDLGRVTVTPEPSHGTTQEQP